MTDPFVADDVLEAVLRSRAGDGAPSDLRAQILAAVATGGPRATPRRSARRPWRLLAVAAVLTGTIGTALFIGGQRQTAVTPTPTSAPADDAVAVTSPVASDRALFAPVPRSCTADKYVVTPGHARPLDQTAQGRSLPPRAFGTTAGMIWGSLSGRPSWSIYVGDADSPFAQAAHGSGDGSGLVVGWSGDHSLLLVSVVVPGPHSTGPYCTGIYVVRADGSSMVVLRDGTTGTPDGNAMSPSGLVAILENESAGPTLSVTDAKGRVLAGDLKPCVRSYDDGVHLLAWSPDSSRLAVRCGLGDVTIVRPDDGSIVQVTGLDHAAVATGMTWTPDGRSLLLADVVSSVLTIDAVDPATSVIASTVSADREASWDVFAGGLAQFEGYSGGVFSPDGRWVVVQTGGPPYDAYLVDATSGATYPVAECVDADCLWASDSTITLSGNSPKLVTAPARDVVANWTGGGAFSFFRPLP